MFLHKENQQLLWKTLQKTPYLVEFTQKFAGHREEWFRGAIEQFYTQWISQNNPLPSNARELLEINKLALQTMVVDLKRLLGYQTHSHSQPNINTNDILPYDVAEERKQREDNFSANFNKYQSEYNNFLKTPDLPMKSLPTQSGGEKIKNMEELVKEQARLRDMDLSIHASHPPRQRTSAPKLRIMDEIDNMEMTIEEPTRIVRFSTNEISSDLHSKSG